jgi:hypothetical protein
VVSKRVTPFSKGGSHYKPPSGIPARGAGWGGAASGKQAKAFTSEDQPPGEVKSAGHAASKTAVEVAKAHAEEMARVLLEVARDVTAPPGTRVDAAHKLIERAEGKAPASVDVTSKGERTGYVVAAPFEAETAEEWTTQHKPH